MEGFAKNIKNKYFTSFITPDPNRRSDVVTLGMFAMPTPRAFDDFAD
jgi:hypothetical protein